MKRFATKQDWLDARKSSIGASDAAAILCVGEYGSAINVWRSKMQDDFEPQFSGDALERIALGNALEKPLIELYNTLKVSEFVSHAPGYVIFYSSVCDSISATPDAILHERRDPNSGKRGVLEIKTTVDHREWGDPESDEIPTRHVVQCAVQMHCVGVDVAHVYALIGGRPKLYVVHRDLVIEDSIISSLAEWHSKYIATSTPPPPDGSDDYSAFIADEFRRRGRRSIETVEMNDKQARYAKAFIYWSCRERVAARKAQLAQQILARDCVDGAAFSWEGFTFRMSTQRARPSYRSILHKLLSASMEQADVDDEVTRLVEEWVGDSTIEVVSFPRITGKIMDDYKKGRFDDNGK